MTTVLGRHVPIDVLRRFGRVQPGEEVAALGMLGGEVQVGVFRDGELVRRYDLVPSRRGADWLIVREAAA